MLNILGPVIMPSLDDGAVYYLYESLFPYIWEYEHIRARYFPQPVEERLLVALKPTRAGLLNSIFYCCRP
jgi:hypothetical protein